MWNESRVKREHKEFRYVICFAHIVQGRGGVDH